MDPHLGTSESAFALSLTRRKYIVQEEILKRGAGWGVSCRCASARRKIFNFLDMGKLITIPEDLRL